MLKEIDAHWYLY